MKKVLQNLVMEGGILLHGSPFVMEEIQPRLTDEEMAICATPFPDIAIIMAIFNSCGPGQRGWAATLNKQTCSLKVRACEQSIAQILNKKIVGYVYAVDASCFLKKSSFEYRAYDPVYIQKRIAVSINDLPFLPTEGQTEYLIPLNRLLASAVN